MNFKILLLLCSFLNFNVNCNTQPSSEPTVSIEVFGLLAALQFKVVFNVLKKLPEWHPLLKSENQVYKALEVAEKQFYDFRKALQKKTTFALVKVECYSIRGQIPI